MAFIITTPDTNAQARASLETEIELLDEGAALINRGLAADPATSEQIAASLASITAARAYCVSVHDSIPDDNAVISELDRGSAGAAIATAGAAMATANVRPDAVKQLGYYAAGVAKKIEDAASIGGWTLLKALWPVLLILALILAIKYGPALRGGAA